MIFVNELGITEIYSRKKKEDDTCMRIKFAFHIDRRDHYCSYIIFYIQVFEVLPSPKGPLALKIPSSSIQAANIEEASLSLESSTAAGNKKTWFISPTEKAKIGNYALQHGYTVALRHYRKDFPALNWTIRRVHKKIFTEIFLEIELTESRNF